MNILLALFDLLYTWLERARQRRALAQMEDRLLGDVGLSRTDAEAEWTKPFWKP